MNELIQISIAFCAAAADLYPKEIPKKKAPDLNICVLFMGRCLEKPYGNLFSCMEEIKRIGSLNPKELEALVDAEFKDDRQKRDNAAFFAAKEEKQKIADSLKKRCLEEESYWRSDRETWNNLCVAVQKIESLNPKEYDELIKSLHEYDITTKNRSK